MKDDHLTAMREVKALMASVGDRMARDNPWEKANALDELVLAMNLLIGLVEGHRHSYWGYTGDGHEEDYTGPMQAKS